MSKKIKQREANKKYRDRHREKVREYARAYYHKNIEKSRIYSDKWRKMNHEQHLELLHRSQIKLRMEILIHYGGDPPKCACCGETIIEFLTLDHVDSQGTKHRRQIKAYRASSTDYYRWLKRNNFPEGYQILCFNCNCGRARTKGKVCPHKIQEIRS